MKDSKDHRRGQDKDKFDRRSRSVRKHERRQAQDREANEALRTFRRGRE